MKARRKNNKDPKENSFKIPIEDFDISEDDEKGEEILNLLINKLKCKIEYGQIST